MLTRSIRRCITTACFAACAALTAVTAVAETIVPGDFNQSVKIKFDGYSGTGALTNFPVIVKLTEGVSGFRYSDMQSDDYSDLRFTKDDGVTTIPFEVEEWKSALPVAATPDTFDGCVLWLRADAGVQTNAVGGVTNWVDQSGNGNHAASMATNIHPAYVEGVVNGKPAVRFNGEDDNYVKFPRITDAQTVIWVLKEDADAVDSTRFLLGDTSNYDFHRGGSKYIWNSSNAARMFKGHTELNGSEVDGRTTLMPTEMSVLSVRATLPCNVDSLSRDRTLAGRSWDGDVAEVIIYNRALTQNELDRIYLYLEDKYAIAMAVDNALTSSVWVQVPLLTNNASIYAYWGNPAATAIPDYTTNGAVWDAGFEGVWHLNDDVGSSVRDATAYNRVGTHYNDPMLGVDGVIESGINFAGGSKYVGVTGYKGVSGTGSRTMSAWIRAGGNANTDIISWGSDDPSKKWIFRMQSSNGPVAGNIRVEVNGGYKVGSTDLRDGKWHYVTAKLADNGGATDVTDVQLYVDGIEESYAAKSGKSVDTNPAGADLRIAMGHGNFGFDGPIDEVRLSSVVRSDDWIKAEYDSQSAPDLFAVFEIARYYDTGSAVGLQPGNGIWSTTDSAWNADAAGNDTPEPWLQGAYAIFEAHGASTVAVGSVMAHKLTFNGTGYTLTGGDITLARGGVEANEDVMIASTLTLGESLELKSAAGKTFTYSGTIDTAGKTLTATGAGGISLSGAVSGGGSIVKEGSGTTVISAYNTFSGGTVVNGGIVQLNTGGSAGALRGEVTVNSNGQLDLLTANALGYGAGTKVDTLNINGGLVNNTAAGDNGWGVTINMTGGELRSNEGVSSGSATQLYSLGGGSAINTLAGAGTATISGRINLRNDNVGNTLAFTVADDLAADDLLISAAITEQSGALAIAKSGPGVMNVTGANTYSGGTAINNGTLLANNAAGLATGTGLTTVNGGILGGAGTVASVAFGLKGGELAPGSSVGTLSIAGDLSLTPSAWLNIEIDSSTVYDAIDVTGSITLNNARLTGSISGTAGPGDKYFIIVNSGGDPVSGTFAGVPQGGSVDIDGQTFTVSYEGDSGSGSVTGGNDVVLYNAITTPAPAGAFWKEISFPGYYRNSTLTNFPALIVLNEEMTEFTYTTFLSPTGGDLRFYSDQSKTAELNYEIEEWNTSGASYIWVQVPELAKDTSIWACWGDVSQSTAPLYTTDGSTWASEYAGVWHMTEPNSPDATANKINGTAHGNSDADGIIGTAQAFDGINDYMVLANDPGLKFGSTRDFTVECWVKIPSSGRKPWPSYIGNKNWASGANTGWGIFDNNNGLWKVNYKGSDGSRVDLNLGNNVSDSRWHYLAVSFKRNAAITAYTDGVYSGEISIVGKDGNIDTSYPITIGNDAVLGYPTICLMDEIRISSVLRSPDWIWASHANQNNPLAFTGQTPASYWDTRPALGLQSGNGIWDNAASAFWSADSVYGSSPLLTWDGTAPDAHFTAAGGGTITVAENVAVERIYFENTGYILSGGSLTLNAGIDAVENATVSSSIALQAEQLWSVAGNKTAKLTGAISGDSAARIFKTGPGTLSLTAHNPFGGGVTVNEGTLLVDLYSWYQNPGHGNGKLIINQGALAEFRQAHAFGGGMGGKDAHINGGTLYFVNDNYVRTIEMTAGLLYGGGENRTVGGGTFTIYAAAAPSVIANRVNLYNNRTINVQDGAAAKDLIISGPISNSNGLTINGPGTVEFTGNNTYAGATLLANNATLLVNNTAGSGIGSGPVTINNGTLGGTGSIVGAVSFGANGGAIAPGASVGTLTVHSNVTFTSAASLDVTVDGIEAGEYSALVVNGAVDLADATLNVTLNTEISGGKPLFLIVNDGTDAVSGTFNNLPEGETFKISGTSFSIFYSADAETGATTGGNDVMLRSNPRGSLMIVR